MTTDSLTAVNSSILGLTEREGEWEERERWKGRRGEVLC